MIQKLFLFTLLVLQVNLAYSQDSAKIIKRIKKEIARINGNTYLIPLDINSISLQPSTPDQFIEVRGWAEIERVPVSTSTQLVSRTSNGTSYTNTAPRIPFSGNNIITSTDAPKQIKKISETITLPSSVIHTNLFLSDDKLIFAQQDESGFEYDSLKQQYDLNNATLVYTGMYYFKNEAIISMNEFGNKTFPGLPAKEDTNNNLLEKKNKYLPLLKQMHIISGKRRMP